mmetsp:Transcript_17407/g.27300  ORF Transcript_17407/g.27300 Transcript_17407/m.27300 type:complete len:88 (+) Transcript_17407:598-861(+)
MRVLFCENNLKKNNYYTKSQRCLQCVGHEDANACLCGGSQPNVLRCQHVRILNVTRNFWRTARARHFDDILRRVEGQASWVRLVEEK